LVGTVISVATGCDPNVLLLVEYVSIDTLDSTESPFIGPFRVTVFSGSEPRASPLRTSRWNLQRKKQERILRIVEKPLIFLRSLSFFRQHLRCIDHHCLACCSHTSRRQPSTEPNSQLNHNESHARPVLFSIDTMKFSSAVVWTVLAAAAASSGSSSKTVADAFVPAPPHRRSSTTASTTRSSQSQSRLQRRRLPSSERELAAFFGGGGGSSSSRSTAIPFFSKSKSSSSSLWMSTTATDSTDTAAKPKETYEFTVSTRYTNASRGHACASADVQ